MAPRLGPGSARRRRRSCSAPRRCERRSPHAPAPSRAAARRPASRRSRAGRFPSRCRGFSPRPAGRSRCRPRRRGAGAGADGPFGAKSMLASMLTDYHLHLRPDEAGTTFERYFTAENVDRYLAAAAEAGIEELGVSEHVYRFRQALDIWSHPLWVENAVDDIDAYCGFVRGTPLRLGVECDYIPGAEERTAALLEARDFDYVVGSVHFIGEGDAAIDHKGFDVWEASGAPDEVWRRYFEM